MFPPIVLLNYNPLLPWYLAPAPWLLGVGFLWLTRYSMTLGGRWGRKYFIASAVLRPLGIALIGYGWLELSSPRILDPEWDRYLAWALLLWPAWALGALLYRRYLPLALMLFTAVVGSVVTPFLFVIPLTIFWLAFVFSVWAIFKLGLRQSFLYRKPGDPFVTDGPYAVVRHPQLFAAMTMAAMAAFTFMDDWGGLNMWGAFNAFAFGVALWLMIRSEEKELARELGERWERYAAEVPRLLPNVDKRVWHSDCSKCGIESPGKLKICPHCGEAKPKIITRPAAASGCLLPVFLPAMLFMIATLFLGKDRLMTIESRWPRSREGDFSLRTLAQSQKVYFAENGFYRRDLEFADYAPETSRFVLCMGEATIVPDKADPEKLERVMAFARSACPRFSGASDTGFTALAIGDLDRDPALEVWFQSDATDPTRLRDDREETQLRELSAEDFNIGD